MNKIGLVSFLMALIFGVVGVLTIRDYGINWDSPNHFNRGQAYLNYYLTGRKDYVNLAGKPRMSYYQDKSESAAYYLKNDSAHPPINGIMAAVFNKILYQELGIFGDIDSYHLFIVVVGAFLVFVVSLWVMEVYGVFAGVVAGIALASYPLFWGESHFNIKDPVETAFFGATIYFFWKSLDGFCLKYLLLAEVFFAFALGTKFNIVFLPLILVPWLLFYYAGDLRRLREFLEGISGKYIFWVLIAPVVVFLIFYLGWPFLWGDPINKFRDALGYYYEIGTGGQGQPSYVLPGGINVFAIVWIFFTTPPLVLLFYALGVVRVMRRWRNEKVGVLWILWLVVPIARVTLPGTSIYGGVRQIMEYIPAMALLAGLGAVYLIEVASKFKVNEKWAKRVVVMLFIPHFFVLYKLHPNENVYFNSLIGGLSGAEEYRIPYRGNSFGNAYLQAVEWLNENAAEGSKLALAQSVERSIPRPYVSEKIFFSNVNWTAFDRGGEYLVELTHAGNRFAYPWVWEYVDVVLDPVYEVQVDGVAIAKIWKNDLEDSREIFRREDESLEVQELRNGRDYKEIVLVEEAYISRLKAEVPEQRGCASVKKVSAMTSENGSDWKEEAEKIGDEQVVGYLSFEEGIINYMLPARKARYIRLYVAEEDSCLFGMQSVEVWGFSL